MGVGAAVSLVLFLFTVLEGVQREANGYVASRDVDVWVSHINSNNLIRSSSYMLNTIGEALDTMPEVARVAPLLRAIARTEKDGRSATFFVLGVDPELPTTLPKVVEGSPNLAAGQMILDRAFAAIHDLKVGQSIRVQNRMFRVVGLSSGTNALVTQFSFTTLEDAQDLLGFPGIVSFWLVHGEEGIAPTELAAAIKRRIPELNPITQEQFSRNNRGELKTGLVPVLWATALFSSLAGGITLTLLLYVGVIERREDYALLLAVGAPKGWVEGLLVRQALLNVWAGLVLGGVAFSASVPLFLYFVPQLTFWPAPRIILAVVAFTLVLGVSAVLLPLHQLRKIQPAEVFRP